MVTWRSIAKFLVPSWLQGPVVDSLAQMVDDFSAQARAGLEARFPSRADDDALALLGVDRGLVRGLSEPSGHYAQRLIGWRFPRGHRVRGSAFALLDQVGNYFGGLYSWTIDILGNKHTRTAAGDESFSYANAWNWDGSLAELARFWVVIDPTQAPILGASKIIAWPSLGVAATWGGALDLPDVSIGMQGFTPDDADLLRELVNGIVPWKPLGSRAAWLIVALDGTTPVPDGTWLHWSKNVAGVQVATRYAGARYVSLYPLNNLYLGDPTNYPLFFTEPDGSLYAGNAASWPATVPLPDGSTYAGNAATWSATIDLVDDGDQTT
jgi:hypothetical protein